MHFVVFFARILGSPSQIYKDSLYSKDPGLSIHSYILRLFSCAKHLMDSYFVSYIDHSAILTSSVGMEGFVFLSPDLTSHFNDGIKHFLMCLYLVGLSICIQSGLSPESHHLF